MTTAKMIGIGKCTGFEMMIGQDTMIVIGRIKIGGTIIKGMIATMITGETMTIKWITRGIVVTNMTVTIHQSMIEMIDVHRKDIDITMTSEGMMTIDKLIAASMMKDGTTIGDPRHLDNFNIILKPEMTRSHRMFGKRIMRMEKLVGRQYLIATST